MHLVRGKTDAGTFCRVLLGDRVIVIAIYIGRLPSFWRGDDSLLLLLLVVLVSISRVFQVVFVL
jgi:hypothetical protein